MFVDRDLIEFLELEYLEMGLLFSGFFKVEFVIIVANFGEEIIVKNKDEEKDLVSNKIFFN